MPVSRPLATHDTSIHFICAASCVLSRQVQLHVKHPELPVLAMVVQSPDLATASGSAAAMLGHTQPVSCIAFAPDGRTLVSSDCCGRLLLWDVASRSCSGTLCSGALGGSVDSMAVSADGRHLVAATRDQVWVADLWARTLGQPRFLPRTSVSVVAPDARHVVTGGQCPGDHIVAAWRVDCDGSDGPRVSLAARMGPRRRSFFHTVTALAVSRDGRLALSASRDQLQTKLQMWDLHTRRVSSAPCAWRVGCIALTPDGSRAVTGGLSTAHGGGVGFWELQSTACLRSLLARPIVPIGQQQQADAEPRDPSSMPEGEEGHGGACVRRLVSSPDGRLAVSSSTGSGALQLWCMESCARLTTLEGHAGSVGALAFSPDSRLLVSGGDDGVLRLWDLVAHGLGDRGG